MAIGLPWRRPSFFVVCVVAEQPFLRLAAIRSRPLACREHGEAGDRGSTHFPRDLKTCAMT